MICTIIVVVFIIIISDYSIITKKLTKSSSSFSAEINKQQITYYCLRTTTHEP